jgi:hypothetical protein
MNSLGVDLTDKVVVIKEFRCSGTTGAVETRLFKCERGGGCKPEGGSPIVVGHFLSNPTLGTETISIEADDIERLAQDREVALVH